MDYFNGVTAAAFEDELEKIAGPLSFLAKGIKGWQSAIHGARQATKRLPGPRVRGALQHKSWGDHVGGIKRLYQQGAKGGGVLGGVGRVAKSPYGNMAGTAAVGGLATYGGIKALPFGRKDNKQGY